MKLGKYESMRAIHGKKKSADWTIAWQVTEGKECYFWECYQMHDKKR